jgi:hypothetical protein
VIRVPEAAAGQLVVEAVPAIVVFFLMHFLLSRAALYANLLTRKKLKQEERALILRYEVIVFFASAVASVMILVAIAFVGQMGWIVLAVGVALPRHGAPPDPRRGGCRRGAQPDSRGHGRVVGREPRGVVPADRGVSASPDQLA